MIIDTQLIPLKSMKVITDLALRTGPEAEESMSHFQGLGDYVNGKSRNFYGSFVSKIAKQVDFSITKLNAQVMTDLRAELGREPYRIEDIPEEVVYKYTKNCMKSATDYKDNSIKAEMNEFKRERVFTDDEGKMKLESEIAAEQDNTKYIDLKDRKEKMTLYVKKLYNKGKRFRTHMMSLVISYERVKRNNPSTSTCKYSMISETTYRTDRDGDLIMSAKGLPLTITNDGAATKAIDFINGVEPNDPAYKAYQDLLWLCMEEGIDLSRENPLNYNEKFIDSLIITRVTKNKEYLNRRYLPSTAKRLRDISVSDYVEDVKIGKSKKQTRDDIIENKILAFRDLTSVEFFKQSKESARTELQLFLTKYCKLRHTRLIMLSKYRTLNDMIVDKSGHYLEIDVSHIIPGGSLYEDSKALVHVKGYLIMIDNYHCEDVLRYLPIKRASEYQNLLIKLIKEKGYEDSDTEYGIVLLKDKIAYSEVSGNFTYGKWETV